MQSPKFVLKLQDITKVVNVFRLKSTWKNKVRDSMKGQVIPDPLENLDFHVRLEPACAALVAEVCSNSYRPRPPARILCEKSKGLCRQIVVPAVEDALILQTLSDAIWEELRTRAPSKNAFYAPEDHSFSKVTAGLEGEYGTIHAWLKFQEKILGFSKEKNFVVVTDVANYYDSVVHNHLRNILADKCSAREHALDVLIYALSHMLWHPDYMPLSGVGLPQIDLDAPRLLAHCVLFEVDEVLELRAGSSVARFMDDIDIGVDSIAEARTILRDLDLTLQTRQLRLNSGKTRILSRDAAKVHFRIKHNALLHLLNGRIEEAQKLGTSLSRERKLLTWAVQRGFRSGAFEGGNGEKILKRCINYARRTGANIPNEVFRAILEDWPALRDRALIWWQSQDNPEQNLSVIVQLTTSGLLVDDKAVLDIGNALVSARLPDNDEVRAHLKQIIASLDEKKVWHFYAKLWILSKFASPKELMQIITSRDSMWSVHHCLSRLVAGMAPRFLSSGLDTHFDNLVRRNGGRSAAEVLDFHNALTMTASGFKAVRKFLIAPNWSLPNRISHAKLLMLISALKNPGLSTQAEKELRQVHQFGLSDPFYKLIMPMPSFEVISPATVGQPAVADKYLAPLADEVELDP